MNEIFDDEARLVSQMIKWYEQLHGVVPVDVLARAHELGIITEEIGEDIE